jgi:hypothetical protein
MALLASAGVAGCATQTASKGAGAAADEPDLETQQVSFQLLVIAGECLAATGPPARGEVVMAAEFRGPGSPLRVFDSGSSRGNEKAIACTIHGGEIMLTSPASPRHRFVRFHIFIPGKAEDIRVEFPDRL